MDGTPGCVDCGRLGVLLDGALREMGRDATTGLGELRYVTGMAVLRAKDATLAAAPRALGLMIRLQQFQVAD